MVLEKNMGTHDAFTSLICSIIYEALDDGDKCLAMIIMILPKSLTQFLLTYLPTYKIHKLLSKINF